MKIGQRNLDEPSINFRQRPIRGSLRFRETRKKQLQSTPGHLSQRIIPRSPKAFSSLIKFVRQLNLSSNHNVEPTSM